MKLPPLNHPGYRVMCYCLLLFYLMGTINNGAVDFARSPGLMVLPTIVEHGEGNNRLSMGLSQMLAFALADDHFYVRGPQAPPLYSHRFSDGGKRLCSAADFEELLDISEMAYGLQSQVNVEEGIFTWWLYDRSGSCFSDSVGLDHLFANFAEIVSRIRGQLGKDPLRGWGGDARRNKEMAEALHLYYAKGWKTAEPELYKLAGESDWGPMFKLFLAEAELAAGDLDSGLALLSALGKGDRLVRYHQLVGKARAATWRGDLDQARAYLLQAHHRVRMHRLLARDSLYHLYEVNDALGWVEEARELKSRLQRNYEPNLPVLFLEKQPFFPSAALSYTLPHDNRIELNRAGVSQARNQNHLSSPYLFYQLGKVQVENWKNNGVFEQTELLFSAVDDQLGLLHLALLHGIHFLEMDKPREALARFIVADQRAESLKRPYEQAQARLLAYQAGLVGGEAGSLEQIALAADQFRTLNHRHGLASCELFMALAALDADQDPQALKGFIRVQRLLKNHKTARAYRLARLGEIFVLAGPGAVGRMTRIEGAEEYRLITQNNSGADTNSCSLTPDIAVFLLPLNAHGHRSDQEETRIRLPDKHQFVRTSYHICIPLKKVGEAEALL